MPGPSKADSTVRIVNDAGEADMTVAVIGDQVVSLVGATDGQVLTVQSDGSVAPETPAAGYSDEQVRDVLAATLVAGSNVTIVVDDAGNTVTISGAAPYTDEQARDAIGTALVAGTGITLTVNDAGDTITVAAPTVDGGAP